MSAPTSHPSLKLSDYLFLAGFCALLFGYSVVEGRTLSTHEAVHCENVREMLADHDWVIPHYGGRTWLERPPLPHWLTALPAALTGHPEREWAMRLGPALMGLVIVLLTAWMASRWFGRNIGILSGAILATMREFLVYSTGPEADIFLCGVVTATFACFTALQFPATGTADTRSRFLGTRPWAMLGFFFFLGLNNLAKGLFFGMIHVLVPVAGYLAWTVDFRSARRYVWLWGWLTFAVAAAAWPLAAYLRQPDVVDLWRSDYMGRMNEAYVHGEDKPGAKHAAAPPPIWLQEPWWYYFANLPLNLAPWTPLAFAGLVLLSKAAWPKRNKVQASASSQRATAAARLASWKLWPVRRVHKPAVARLDEMESPGEAIALASEASRTQAAMVGGHGNTILMLETRGSTSAVLEQPPARPVQDPKVQLPGSRMAESGAAYELGPGNRVNYRFPDEQAGSAEKFLLCWAVLPVLFFSLPQGKHHHYLLHCTAPWAVLTAHAAVRLWQYAASRPRWLARPWLVLLSVALPSCIALAGVRLGSPRNLPGPNWVLATFVVGLPAVVLGIWWAIRHSNPRTAFCCFFGILIAVTCCLSAYRTKFLDHYGGDRTFLHEVAKRTDGQLVYLNNDCQPLEASWFLYYSEQPMHLLQNLTFLQDNRIHEDEVFVIARKKDSALLDDYGSATPLLTSERSRLEATPQDRWTLFRLRFRDNLKRVPADVAISSMQATGRAHGPFLDGGNTLRHSVE